MGPVITLALAAGVLVTLAALVVGVMVYRDQQVWRTSPPYSRRAASPPRTLVVHYSRTGNSQAVAKEVARWFEAEVLQVEAPLYGFSFQSSLRAPREAGQRLRTTPVEHVPVDPADFDLVVWCAPTWWFRPAVPL